ncbi:MAG: hypothetical protein WC635_11330 [Bacteriovorax sp.]|jgi:hypothetical protein
MSVKTNEEIIKHKLHEVEEKLKHQDFFSHYILETLDNFAYRYFDNPKKAEQISGGVTRVCAIENGIKEAIKLKIPELRAGIADLVKRVSKEQGPTILREIKVTKRLHEASRGGIYEISARISFGHPEHDFKADTYVEKLSTLNFDDDIQFRNTLARKLEEVCELFC